jgi:hypothetical protein
MSAADDIGKSAVGGPAAVVVELARGFLTRAFRPSKKTEYRIGGERVSGPEFRARVGVTLPGQRPAPPGKMPPPQVAAPSPPPIPGPPSDAEWERRRREAGYYERKGAKPPGSGAPPKKPPPPSGPTAADSPRAGGGGRPGGKLITKQVAKFMAAHLGKAGVAVSIGASVAYLLDLWQRTFPGRPIPTDYPPEEETGDLFPPRRTAPGSQGGKGTNRPALPPQIIVNVPAPNVIVNVPAMPAPPTVATPMPAPVPRAPPASSPAPAPRAPPAPAPARGVPTWAMYAPALLPLLWSSSSSKRKRRSTPGTSPGLIPGVPGLTPGLSPGLGLAPSVADYPLFSGGNYFDSTPQNRNCECGPKKKRKPKKARAVCYTGRFTERANGLRKYEKRKIKCR